MKKIISLLALLFLFPNFSFAASVGQNDLTSALNDTGNSFRRPIILSGTPGTITTVAIPDSAKGFKLYPQSNDVSFAVNQTLVAAPANDSDTTILSTDWVVGAFAKGNTCETRLLPPSTSRTLQILSATASVVVELEVF